MFLMCSETRGKKKDVLLRIKLENFRWRAASIVCKPNSCCSVVSLCLTLWSRGLQHARLPCLSPSPGACSNSCPLSWWCHPTISFSVAHFSSCLQSFPASGSSSVSQFFSPGGQSIGASASASVLPMNIQGWFPLGWTGWILGWCLTLEMPFLGCIPRPSSDDRKQGVDPSRLCVRLDACTVNTV